MRYCLFLFLLVGTLGFAQQPQSAPSNDAPPRSDQTKDRQTEAGDSSSRDTRIDIAPPKDDEKNHPNSGAVNPDSTPEEEGVGEMHPWNPYRALKDDEVGDFYFKKKDYKAAKARYEDALLYKDRDAVATFRLGECNEKMNQPDEAIKYYQEYLKILPEGPSSKDAKKALQRLGAPDQAKTDQAKK